jgi:hypothetical protein
VDERADAGDQQYERHRQLIELERHVGLEAADRDPAEQMLVQRPVFGVVAQHVGEEHEADHERGGGHDHAEPVARTVQPAPAAQQHGRADERRRDEQSDE